MSKKVLVAMSGGVDSSVAAYLVKNLGYDVVGATMKLFDNEDINMEVSKTCCSLSDVEDARAVANKLDIPYYVFNYKDNFKEKVIDKFVACYNCGKTPNPCIDCNRFLKFNHLMKRAEMIDAEFVVTGHYARVVYDESKKRYLLKKGLDESKDQSYVLYSLTQDQLSKTLFPVGELTKVEVREIAAKNGFVNSNKPDSQDICFVKDGDYKKFIEDYTGKKYKKGDFVDLKGNVLGKHDGIIGYTIGQRKGLGVSSTAPLYVVKKDMENNKVILGRNDDLFTDTLVAEDVNFISIDKLEGSLDVKAKIRYKHKEADAVISPLENSRVLVKFKEPQRAIASGQAVVFYDGDVVVGGGTIE